MNTWTDAWLREVATWKAVKEGKELRAAAAVIQAEVQGNTIRGAVRIGKTARRLSIVIAGPHDVTTKCGCPENRSTGGMCAHAVALLLEARDGAAKPPQAQSSVHSSPQPVSESAPVEVQVIAWNVEFSPRWESELAQGRLTVLLSRRDGQPGIPDLALSQWAAVTRIPCPKVGKPVPAQLRDQEILSLFAVLDGCEALRLGKGDLITFRSGVSPVLHGRWQKDGALEVQRETDEVWRACLDSKGALMGLVVHASTKEVGFLTVPENLAASTKALIDHGRLTQSQDEWRYALKAWQRVFSFADDSWLAELRFEAAPARFELLLDGSLERLQARLNVQYRDGLAIAVAPLGAGGDDEAFLYQEENGHFLVRNQQAEQEAWLHLQRGGFSADSDGYLVARGEERVLQILADVLPNLGDNWNVREEPSLLRARAQIEIIRPQFREMGAGNDWLAFDVSFLGDSGSVLDRDQIQRLLKAGGGKATLKGKRVVLDAEFRDVWAPLFAEADIRQEQGHWVAKGDAIPVFDELRKKSHKGSEINAKGVLVELPDFVGELRSRLREYQATGVAWLIERMQRWGCALLADDMGLGKTVQTIAWMRGLGENPALVVAPTSLLGNWEQEIRKFAPELKCVVLHGTNRERMREEISTSHVVITSYGTLTRDLAMHLQREYSGVVLDEASMIRNPDTDVSRAVAKLRAGSRLALTGTPVENGVRDLWGIFRFLRPGYLGSRDQFTERYEKPLTEGAGAGAGVLQRLRLKVSPFMLRRTKEEVAKDLPGKIEIDEWCELTREQQAVYRDLLKRGAELADEAKRRSGASGMRMQVLTALLRMRQTCCDLSLLESVSNTTNKLSLDQRSSKLARLRERLREAVASGHRVLVFSQFARQLRLIRMMLDEDQITSCLLDGSTRDRSAEVARFQRPDGPSIFLISLKAGGYGLNLTEADVVVHFDPWWNPAAEAQATDRAHRIGQTRPVTVYRFLTKGTVEEKVRKLQEQKRELLRSTFDDNNTSDPSSLSDKELWQLLEG